MHPAEIPDTHALIRAVAALGDDELLRGLGRAVLRSRRVEVEIVAHIAEIDERRLWAREACSSMFTYCTEVLHLSEAEAYLRITAARAARIHADLLPMLADGRLHLRAITKLAPLLTEANHRHVLERAAHLPQRQIDELAAELGPRADAPALVRKLPAPRPPHAPPTPASDHECRGEAVAVAPSAPSRSAVIQPTAPSRYKVQFTASAALRAKLERLVVLMRHKIPDGDLATALEEAVTEKLARLEARRFGGAKPRTTLATADTTASGSRHIPAPVRRFVAERDEGRCSYISASGRRCGEVAWLEFEHARPHARGGDRSPANIRLMCRAHNVYLAERDFGRERMARYHQPRPATARALGGDP